jgi:hypothetical protein
MWFELSLQNACLLRIEIWLWPILLDPELDKPDEKIHLSTHRTSGRE